MKIIYKKPKSVTKKQTEPAKRSLRRTPPKTRRDIKIGTHNLVAAGITFTPGSYYHAQWLVDGVERYSNTFEIPPFECRHITASTWMTMYIETVLIAFNLDHVDVIVNEVKQHG